MANTLRSQEAAEAVAKGWDPRLTNDDIIPNPVRARTWDWWNYAALWTGLVANMVAFSLLGGLIAIGYSAFQVMIIVAIGSVIQLGFFAITGRIGSRFGINFAVWARTAFGTVGANVPALIRGCTGIAYVGVQVVLAGQVINVALGSVWGSWSALDERGALGVGLGLWISMLAFWLLHFWIIRHGMATVRRFQNWAGPGLIVAMIPLTVWSVVEAGGLGPVFTSESKFDSFGAFLTGGAIASVAVFISGGWATLMLNYPDLTRFARSNRQQVIGTSIGLPLGNILFYGMVIILISTMSSILGESVWVPADLLRAIGNPWLVVLGAALIVLATLSTNVAANLVSPAYDLANAFPRWLKFLPAAWLSLILAVAYQPWYFMQNPDRLFEWLNVIGAFLGPATGILLADYLIVRKRKIDVESLYLWRGRYSAYRGFNLVGLSVLVSLTLICLAGKVFPAVGFLYTYAWFVGVSAAFVVYAVVAMALRAAFARSFPEFDAVGSTGEEADDVTSPSQGAPWIPGSTPEAGVELT